MKATDATRWLMGLTHGKGGLCVDRQLWARSTARTPPDDLDRRLDKAHLSLGNMDFTSWPDDQRQEGSSLFRAMGAFCLDATAPLDLGGWGGGGGRGNGYLSYEYLSGPLIVSVNMARQAVQLGVAELKGPCRRVSFWDSGDGGLQLRVNDAATRVLLQQGRAGGVSLLIESPDGLFAARAKSYAELAAKYPQCVQGDLMGHLARLGIGVPPARASRPAAPE